ncbi:uncharacterized protein LOC144070852 [Stigmatopora argus]
MAMLRSHGNKHKDRKITSSSKHKTLSWEDKPPRGARRGRGVAVSEFKRPAATPPFFKMADEPETGSVGLLSCSELTISRRKTRQTSSRTMQRVRPPTRRDCWETSRLWP